jgi:hypothetical protein
MIVGLCADVSHPGSKSALLVVIGMLTGKRVRHSALKEDCPKYLDAVNRCELFGSHVLSCGQESLRNLGQLSSSCRFL